MKRVIIWGAGPSGTERYEIIKNEYEVVAFTDINESKWGTYIEGVKIISPEETYRMCDEGAVDLVIMGVAHAHYDEVYQQLSDNTDGWKETYYMKEWGDCRLVRYSENYLAYLELDATRACNLNCRGCSRFSNITEESDGVSLESLERDMKRMSELFNNIAVVKVLGGEPLLRKDLDRFLITVKKYFPDCQLELLSNGLLVPKIEPHLLKVLKDLDVRLMVTEYEPTKKMMPEIVRFCEDNGLPFRVFVTNREEFYKNINLSGDSDGSESVKNCMAMYCTIVKDGVINRCGFPVYCYELNRKYGTKLPENTGLDIYEEGLSAAKIKAFLKNTDYCRWCTEKEMFTWGNGRQEARLSDWVVRGDVG